MPLSVKVTEERKQSPNASNTNCSALNLDNNFLMGNKTNESKMWPGKEISHYAFKRLRNTLSHKTS